MYPCTYCPMDFFSRDRSPSRFEPVSVVNDTSPHSARYTRRSRTYFTAKRVGYNCTIKAVRRSRSGKKIKIIRHLLRRSVTATTFGVVNDNTFLLYHKGLPYAYTMCSHRHIVVPVFQNIEKKYGTR